MMRSTKMMMIWNVQTCTTNPMVGMIIMMPI